MRRLNSIRLSLIEKEAAFILAEYSSVLKHSIVGRSISEKLKTFSQIHCRVARASVRFMGTLKYASIRSLQVG